MTSLPGSSHSDVTALRDLILACANSPNQLKLNGKIVVSTFAGENCTFGERTVGAGWQRAVKEGMPPVGNLSDVGIKAAPISSLIIRCSLFPLFSTFR